jgi:hypothetical protein
MCYLIDVYWLIVVFRFSIILPNKSSVINMFLIICTLFFYSTRIMPGYSDCHLVLGLFPWLVGANKPPAFPKDRPGSKMNLLASQSVRIFAYFSQSIPSSPIGAPILSSVTFRRVRRTHSSIVRVLSRRDSSSFYVPLSEDGTGI